MLRLGVLGLQGAVSEHVDAVTAAAASLGLDVEAKALRHRADLDAADGLILPGGESTTISKLLRKFELQERLIERVRSEDLPVLGTCAGLILLSSEGDAQVAGTDTQLLGLMAMATNRNAFGRQRESFEAPVDVKGLDTPFRAVFIRAPAITRSWGACEELGTVAAPLAGGGASQARPVVAAREGNRFALAFHPELTDDTRLHQLFLNAVAAWR